MENTIKKSKSNKKKNIITAMSVIFSLYILFQYIPLITMPLENNSIIERGDSRETLLEQQIGKKASKVLEERYGKQFQLIVCAVVDKSYFLPSKVRVELESSDGIRVLGTCNTRFLKNQIIEENYLSEKWDKEAATYYQEKISEIYASAKAIDVSLFVGINIGSGNQYFTQEELLNMKNNDFHYYWAQIEKMGKFNITFKIKTALKDGATEQMYLEDAFKMIQFVRTKINNSEHLQAISYNFEIYDKTQVDERGNTIFEYSEIKKHMEIDDSSFKTDRPNSAEDLKPYLLSYK